jgi:hypothetical protein
LLSWSLDGKSPKHFASKDTWHLGANVHRKLKVLCYNRFKYLFSKPDK